MDLNTTLPFSETAEQVASKQWLQPITSGRFQTALLAAVLIPFFTFIIHRLYIDPLRKIPGPWLAAFSNLYGFYYDYLQDGYSKRFKDFHKKYNSHVVRIGPGHVHVDSPDFYDKVFQSGSKYYKDPSFYKYFGGLDSMIDVSHYRTYRNHLSSLYSARSVDSLVPKIVTELQMVAKQLQRSLETGKEANMQRILRTLSADMILQLLFSNDVNLFKIDDYHPFLESFDTMMRETWLFLNCPLAVEVLGLLLPGSKYAKTRSAGQSFGKYCEKWANEYQEIRNSGTKPERDSHMKRYLDIDPSDEKKVKAVPHPLEDVFNFVSGGSDTTAYSTACAIYYVLTSPKVLSKLQEELDAAAPFIRYDFDNKKIQSLPYLSGVVKETLRLSSPVPGCNPRIVPEGGVTVGSVYIPQGTAVSVSQLAIHQNEDIFPEPQKFIPERWLGEKGKAIEKWNVAFSRGPRQCIGTNLAYLELFCCLAYLFSHFELALSGDYGNELEWADRFVATNEQDIKVKVVRDRWA